MNRDMVIGGALTLLVAALAAGGYQWWRVSTGAKAPAAVVAAPAPGVARADRAPAASAALVTPAIRHPIETQPELPPADAPPAPAAPPGDAFAAALETLLGAREARRFAILDDAVVRAVTTVDNLDREHAAARLWPVAPMPGRFGVVPADAGSTRIAAANAARYEPFVRFVEAIDTPRLVALYVRFYPRFQQAYADLGYPRRYFNDRLVQVIDALLAAPTPAAPPAVRLVEVKGSVPSTMPWTRYEFADPALERLPAGQKIMLRVGAANALRLKAKLAEFRAGITRGLPPR